MKVSVSLVGVCLLFSALSGCSCSNAPESPPGPGPGGELMISDPVKPNAANPGQANPATPQTNSAPAVPPPPAN